MEPSCLAVFRDEMQRDAAQQPRCEADAAELLSLGGVLREAEVELPKLDGKAIVWGHCHHKATGGIEPGIEDAERTHGAGRRRSQGRMLRPGRVLGFATGKYDISMQCGEVGLLPAVRKADPSTMIIANGFSCKTQLDESNVGRHALHMGEVMRIARMLGGLGVNGKFPEQLRAPKPEPSRRVKIARRAAVVGLCAGAALAGATLATSMRQTDESR